MKLSESTWTQVEEYLNAETTILIPIGSTEQHGPTGIIGTDFTTSQAIAEKAGEQTGVLVAPPVCYGMARHHMAFPGSATLAPSTFILVIRDIVQSFARHGFKQIVFVNGHGGNIAPLLTAYSEIKDTGVDLYLKTVNWYELPDVVAYEKEHFGEANGFHATCGEVSMTQFLHPRAFERIPHKNFDIARPSYQMPLSPTQFRETFPDGRMMSDPGLATARHGAALFELAVAGVVAKLNEIRSLRN